MKRIVLTVLAFLLLATPTWACQFQGFVKYSTAVNVTVLLIASSDHITGKTGEGIRRGG